MYHMFNNIPPLRGRALMWYCAFVLALVLLMALAAYLYCPDHSGAGYIALAGLVFAVIMLPLSYLDMRQERKRLDQKK